MSTTDPEIEEVKGATYHDFLKRSKIFTSKFCATMKAAADPIAIRIDIVFSKLVETKNVKTIPIKKPIKIIILAIFFHKHDLLNQ